MLKQSLQVTRHRSGEQQRLSSFGQAVKDGAQLVLETNIKNSIRLIQHQELNQTIPQEKKQ